MKLAPTGTGRPPAHSKAGYGRSVEIAIQTGTDGQPAVRATIEMARRIAATAMPTHAVCRVCLLPRHVRPGPAGRAMGTGDVEPPHAAAVQAAARGWRVSR